MIVALIILWCTFNTIVWIKNNEPYDFKVHFLFIPYLFSNSSNFKLYLSEIKNNIKESLFTEKVYVDNYIKKFLYERNREKFEKFQIFDIKIRKKEGYKIYLHLYSKFEFPLLDIEMELFNELKKKVEIIFVHHNFLK